MLDILPYIAGIITFTLGVLYFVGLKQLKENVKPSENISDAN